MNNALRTALAALVIFFGSNVTSYAATTSVSSTTELPFCIPFFTCKVSPPKVTPPKTPAKPSVPNAPEIEASVAASGIALVAATTMMLRGRRRKQ